MNNHKDLKVWRQGIELTKLVYQLTLAFPESEKYGLVGQMRRAALSIPSNISEGAARHSKKEFAQFLYIAMGSCAELDTQMIVCEELGFITSEPAKAATKQIEEIKRMIQGLINYNNTKERTEK
ncbi:MAG: four helix bundle protein [Candidatus Cloacimonadota bacterium]